jgi:hypothetical protein
MRRQSPRLWWYAVATCAAPSCIIYEAVAASRRVSPNGPAQRRRSLRPNPPRRSNNKTKPPRPSEPATDRSGGAVTRSGQFRITITRAERCATARKPDVVLARARPTSGADRPPDAGPFQPERAGLKRSICLFDCTINALKTFCSARSCFRAPRSPR